jgi:hypothetical protein
MRSLLISAMMLASLPAPAEADVILEQIGGYTHAEISQRFDPSLGLSAFDLAVVDDFNLVRRTKLTSVSVDMLSTDPDGPTNYSVEIYSSKDAALLNLTGDVASRNFAPAQVTSAGGIFTIDNLDITLAAGSYWLAVIPTINSQVFGVAYVKMDMPGNAHIVNPAGGFGMPEGYTLFLAAAFNLYGDAAVPEPGTWAMLIAGFGLIGAAMRRQRPRLACS